MSEAFFAEASVDEIELSSGTRIGLPVRYYDWEALHAIFPVSAAKVQRLLPSIKLKPILVAPGIATVTFSAFEYRRIADVAPYNEFAVSVPVQYEPRVNLPGLPLLFNPLVSPKWFSRFGSYIYHLPVTTQEACDLGVEIWGYPKVVAEIIFEDADQVRRCRLRAEGKDVITLEVKKLATKSRALRFCTYSVKNDELLRTPVEISGRVGIARLPGGASYTLHRGPIAEELKALEIGKRALGRMYITQAQSMLHPADERLPLQRVESASPTKV